MPLPADAATPRWHTWVYLILGFLLLGVTWDYRSSLPLLGAFSVPFALSLVWRDRYPYLLAATGLLLLGFHMNAAGSVALFAFAIRKRGVALWVVSLLAVATVVIGVYLPARLDGDPEVRPDMLGIVLSTIVLPGFLVGLPVLLGLYVQYSRENLGLMVARARAAEDERELRARDAVLSERQRIATEMHDSLGHRLALLTMQAGALEVNAGAGPDAVAAHAEMMRATAREALQELREAIGALAAGDEDPVPHGVADLPHLIDRNRDAGARITVENRLAEGVVLAENVDRTIYRVVQEGLTNAHKHAPNTRVTIVLDQPEQNLVRVAVRNALPVHQRGKADESVGMGLVALAERVRLAGGQLRAEPTDRDFVLEATLPREPESESAPSPDADLAALLPPSSAAPEHPAPTPAPHEEAP